MNSTWVLSTKLGICDLVSGLAQVVTALAGGQLCAALAGRTLGEASGMTAMSRWMTHSLPVDHPRSLAAIAAIAIAFRGIATLVSQRLVTRSAAQAGAEARRRLLVSALSGVSVDLGAAVVWPDAIEEGVWAQRAAFRSKLHLAVLCGAVLMLDPMLAAVLIVMLVPFGLLLRPMRRRLRTSQVAANESARAMVGVARDVVEHAPLWASTGGEQTVLRRLAVLSDEAIRMRIRGATLAQSLSSGNELLSAFAILTLVSLFGVGVTRPTLLPMVVLLVSSYRPLRDLSEVDVARHRSASARQSLATVTAPKPAAQRSSLGEFSAVTDLVVTNLQLAHGGPTVRSGLSFSATVGNPLLLIGPPGSGKSTLLACLAGVAVQSAGTICCNGHELSGPPGPQHWPVAWVPAAPPILPGSLAENLSPNDPTDATRLERARNVLRLLGDDIFAQATDDLSLGTRGRLPSSGECMRIALARALSSEQPIILLDEPSANLDEGTERQLISLLQHVALQRVVVIATHRGIMRNVFTNHVELSE